MTWAATVEAIRERFRDEVATPRELPLLFGTEPPHTVDAITGHWCRVTVQAAARWQASTGSAGKRRFRTAGLLLVQVFAPLSTGDGELLEIVDAIDDAFLGVQLSVPDGDDPPILIRFRPPFPFGEPQRDDDVWSRCDVRIPFESDSFGGAAP